MPSSSICAAMFFTLCSLLLPPCFFAEAQQPTKLPKIGFLSSGFSEGSSGFGEGRSSWRESFVREFGKLGYVEGSVTFEFRNAKPSTIGFLPSQKSWFVSRLM